MDVSRRETLMAAVLGASHGGPLPADRTARVQTLLDRYIALGDKRSGGAGDNAAGAWLEGELKGLGFALSRQAFPSPFFEVDKGELTVGSHTVAVAPQPLVTSTAPSGVSGRLRVLEPWSQPGPMDGAIVLIPLPHARWSTSLAPAIVGPIKTATSAGAAAIVLITTGPTGEAIMLNADAARPLSDRPVAILGPKAAAPLLKAAAEGADARLTITGRAGHRPAFNIVGRLERGFGRWLVVSTPRSGWDVCAGERGPGIALWLLLAAWACSHLRHDLLFLCNSGHEYENLGAENILRAAAPPVDETALWLHLGANLAARDWRQAAELQPLPSADPQRFLAATSVLVAACEAAFRGLPGLEAVTRVDRTGAPGELGPILQAGYTRVAGAFGAHRFHHTVKDDARCVSAPLVVPVFDAFRNLAERVLIQGLDR